MNPESAAKVLQAGRDCGADFVELYEEETRSSVLGFKDGKVETATAATEYGIGIRLLYGTQVLYTHASSEDADVLVQLVRELAFGRSAGFTPAPLAFSPMQEYLQSVAMDPKALGQGHKLPLLRSIDQVARAVSGRVSQVAASIADTSTVVEIWNSEGLCARDHRTRTRLNIGVTAGQGGDRISSHEAPGALGGYEVLESMDMEGLARQCAERTLRMLDAPYIPGGQMPVVMGNGFGGVIFHEACGHPLETESVRRNASPFAGRIGDVIAGSAVTAIDDGTMPGLWGSIHIDDEGMPTQRTLLIENGVLRSFLSDRVGSVEVGVPRTGSARRESYKYAPVSRMRNTFIAPGKDSLDDMIASVDNGLFAARMGGGSVNPATGEFNFAVEEGFRIQDGKIAGPVRGATLIGRGHEILPRISMVGADFATAAGMCGASSGSVPVTVGQPSLKVDRILVGGR